MQRQVLGALSGVRGEFKLLSLWLCQGCRCIPIQGFGQVEGSVEGSFLGRHSEGVSRMDFAEQKNVSCVLNLLIFFEKPVTDNML